MIHTLLDIKRSLFVIDSETTGLSQDARIIELGFQRWVPEVGMDKEWRSLINPGIPIPPAVTEVHHITDEMINACQTCGLARGACTCQQFHAAPRFAQIAASLAKGFSDCDLAGQNVRYDLGRIAYEMHLAKQPWSYAGARIIDSSRLESLAEPRHLSDLHKKYTGMPHDGAHGALSDVRAAATVIARQLESYTLPRDLDALHELSWPGYITAGGEFRFVDGVAVCCFGKHKDKPLKSLPKDYLDWILANNFAPDVIQLARDARAGMLAALHKLRLDVLPPQKVGRKDRGVK